MILDASIEDGAGLEFAKEIIGNLPIIPVILVTTEDRVRSIEMALEIGAADSICQPLELEAVLKSVERVLKRREQLEKWIHRRSHESTDNLRQRLDVLERLQQVGHSVTSSLDLDQVLTNVVDAAVGMTERKKVVY